MSYTEVFKEDAEYQKHVTKFKREKESFDRIVKNGRHDKEVLKKLADNIMNETNQFATNYYTEGMKTIKGNMGMYEDRINDIGYSERADEVKEFEMRYKLADERELKNMVQDLKSDDLLELNLLRSELNNRDLVADDGLVKRYITQNNIGGLSEDEQAEYDALGHKHAVLNTLRDRALIVDDEYLDIGSIQKDFDNQIATAKEPKEEDTNVLVDRIMNSN